MVPGGFTSTCNCKLTVVYVVFQSPARAAVGPSQGSEQRAEKIILDEVQCKYCLRTVNQKTDLTKHYRFCLGLKAAKAQPQKEVRNMITLPGPKTDDTKWPKTKSH